MAAAVCVVGTHWGETHCQALRAADPRVRLFVCGRDTARTARIARVWRAEGYILGSRRRCAIRASAP